MTLLPENVTSAHERLVTVEDGPIAELGGVRLAPVATHDHGESDVDSDGDVGTTTAPIRNNGAALHSTTLSLIVSFDMTRPDLIERPGMKNMTFDLGSTTESFNFANPFTRGNAKKGSPRGAVRPVLDVIANLAAEMSSDVTYVGRETDVSAMVNDLCARFNASLIGCLPAAPITLVYEEQFDGVAGDADVPGTPGVLFRDLIDINTWAVTEARGDGLGYVHNIFINCIVNAMPAFESAEPHRFIVQGLNAVESFFNAFDLNLAISAAIRFDTNLLDQQPLTDLLTFFVAEENGSWATVGRRSIELGISAHNEFVQSDNAGLLFGETSDLLLFYQPDVDDGEVELAEGENQE